MFRTYTLDCHAANPQMPLEPVCPYAGSAATFVLINLPRPHGKQRIDSVTLSITNADAAVSAHPATREGSSWIVTVPASAIGPAGNVRESIIISASGVDEQNRPVQSWIIGVADLRVRHQDGTAVPGEPRVLISWFESRPANPRGVFICTAQPPETGLDLYNGRSYIPLVTGGITLENEVTRDSSNGVKSSGIWSAIWGTLAALPTGFTSLYDWCAAKIEAEIAALHSGKRGIEDLDVYGNGQKWVIEGSLPEGVTLDAEQPVFEVGAWRWVGHLPDVENLVWMGSSDQGATECQFDLSGSPGSESFVAKIKDVLVPSGDHLAKESQLAEKRPLTDNTCHRTDFTEWTCDRPGYTLRWNEEATDMWYPYVNGVAHRAANGKGAESDTELTWHANTDWGESFDLTFTRSAVCTKDNPFTTFDIVTALVNGVKSLLGSVASGYSTFDAWIASKFDTAKAVPAFAETSTYEVGEIVLHDGTAYKCTTAVTTAGAWTGSTNWAAASDADLAARLKGLKSDGTATDDFATQLMGKQVAKEALSKGYAFFDLVPVTEGGFKVFAAKDHAINRFTLADATPVKVILPNATDANGRDFILKVNVTSATMPTFEIVKPTDAASVGIEAADDGWADLDAGINYFTITETDRA